MKKNMLMKCCSLFLILSVLLAGCTNSTPEKTYVDYYSTREVEVTKISPTVKITDVLNRTMAPSLPNTYEPTITRHAPTKPIETVTPDIVEIMQPTLAVTYSAGSFLPEHIQNTWIAFSRWGFYPGVYVIRPDGSEQKRLVDADGIYNGITWAPDGHMIAYTFSRGFEDPLGRIMIISIDGQSPRQITPNDTNDNVQPSWSPDGEQIVFASQNVIGNQRVSNIKIINLRSMNIMQITNGDYWHTHPVWAPSGNLIYFFSSYPDYESVHLMAIRPDGSDLTHIVDVPRFPYGSMTISSDGNHLLFRSLPEGDRECGQLYRINLDGTNMQGLTSWSGEQSDPSFSPDPRFFVMSALTTRCGGSGGMPKSGSELFIADLKTRNIYQVTDTLIDQQSNETETLRDNVTPRYPAWAPVPGMKISAWYKITALGDHLNLRQEHQLSSAVIRKLRTGEVIQIKTGPLDEDSYYWWQVETSQGEVGWVVEVSGWLQEQK